MGALSFSVTLKLQNGPFEITYVCKHNSEPKCRCSFAVDRVGLRRQHGLYLEPADEGDCAETPGPHRYCRCTVTENADRIAFLYGD